MKQKFFPPDGVITNRQATSFLDVMTELHKRFKNGTLSPEFTLSGLQDLVEGKYAKKTNFGVLKLFGPPVEAYDKQTPNGFGPCEFFKDDYAEFAEKFPADKSKKLLPLFAFRRTSVPDVVQLAPYRVCGSPAIRRILYEIDSDALCPNITLGHIGNLIARFASGIRPNDVLFEGRDGNYFLIRDIHGSSWFVHLWLHPDGRWYYRFIGLGWFPAETPESLKKTFKSTEKSLHGDARLWLRPPCS